MIQGLRTTIYRVADLDRAKEWYASLLSRHPYFYEILYVGFEVNSYKLVPQLVEPKSPCSKGRGVLLGCGGRRCGAWAAAKARGNDASRDPVTAAGPLSCGTSTATRSAS